MNLDALPWLGGGLAVVAAAVHLLLWVARLSVRVDELRRELDHERTLRNHFLNVERSQARMREQVDAGFDFEPVSYREAIPKYPLPTGVTDPVAKKVAELDARRRVPSPPLPEPGRGKVIRG